MSCSASALRRAMMLPRKAQNTATGLEPHDPRILDEYGYTRYENVLTSLELERLINSGGPTHGNLLRPGDRKQPASIGFIQCVGSRSARRGKPYCSNTCCMNTIKSTLVLKEHHPDIEIQVFYIDIRAFGKGFEDLYTRSRRLGRRCWSHRSARSPR